MVITASTAIATGKSLLSLAQNIATVVKKAQESPDVVKRVLFYLKAIQDAVGALGHERQEILADARKCDVQDHEQVSALWMRLDRYLHEDYVRPQLQIAISGLGACREAIEKEAKGILWRNRDKEAAVKAFSSTVDELKDFLRTLASDFYPGRSGMGIQTLRPIYELLSRIRKDPKFPRAADTAATHPQPAAVKSPRRKSQSGPGQSHTSEALEEELGELVRQALRDPSHTEWFSKTAKVEALAVELELAFAVRVTQHRQPTSNGEGSAKKAPRKRRAP
jgi:hypothetical protein